MRLFAFETLFRFNESFWDTGLDYFELFIVKVGRRLKKRYGDYFTCF